jgi:hypothetical protein
VWLFYNINQFKQVLEAGVLPRKEVPGLGTHGLNYINQFGHYMKCPKKGKLTVEVWHLKKHPPFEKALDYSQFVVKTKPFLLKKEVIDL